MDKKALDQKIAELDAHKTEWARLAVESKLVFVDQLRQKTKAIAPRWVEAAIHAKSIPPDSPWVGEEWVSGPWAFLHNLNGMSRTLKAIAAGERPSFRRGAMRRRANGQTVVEVFPETVFDWLLLNGYRLEVWMQEGVTPDNLSESMGSFYRQKQPEGKVALVLGAGNIASITPLDVLYRLMAMGHVCIAKMNPVNDYLGPYFEEIFSTLIEPGYVQFAYGGEEVGAYLVGHDRVEEIHLTGSYKTFDRIVFGGGKEGEARKRRGQPVLRKPITAELGGVGPTIVAPGPWTDADIRYQAAHILTQKHHNGGFNCIAAQVLILPREWDRSGDLLEAIRNLSHELAPRAPYYPGAGERQRATLSAHPNAEVLDEPGRAMVQRLLITDLDPSNAEEFCYRTEFFNSALSQTSLPGKTPAEFLRGAVDFVNDRLLGSLGVNLLIHPATLRQLGPALDEALARLRYGNIGVNTWTGVNYLLSQSSWGASTASSIRST